MSDLCVKVVGTEISARVHCRAVKRIVLEIIDAIDSSKRAGRRVGAGLHADPVPECFVTWRKHPTLSRWFVGPIPHAVARILDGRTINIGGTPVTFDTWPLVTSAGESNCFDLDDIEAAFHSAAEEPEVGD